MRIDIITIFPGLCEPYLGDSILKRAIKKKLVSFRFFNPRDFTYDAHKTVDDSPYGGGSGMVLKPEALKCRREKNGKAACYFILSARQKVHAKYRSPSGEI